MNCTPRRSENGYRLCTFWSRIRYGFLGNYESDERIRRFNSTWISQKQRWYAHGSKWILMFKRFFRWRSHLSNFRSENGSGFPRGKVWKRVWVNNDIFLWKLIVQKQLLRSIKTNHIRASEMSECTVSLDSDSLTRTGSTDRHASTLVFSMCFSPNQILK